MIKNILFAFVLPLSFSFNTIPQPEQASFGVSPTTNLTRHTVTSNRYQVTAVIKTVELDGRQLMKNGLISGDDIASIRMGKDAAFALLNRDKSETEYYMASGNCSGGLCSPKFAGIVTQGGGRIIKTGTKKQFEQLLAKLEAATSASENE